jgi:hypothetical protein
MISGISRGRRRRVEHRYFLTEGVNIFPYTPRPSHEFLCFWSSCRSMSRTGYSNCYGIVEMCAELSESRWWQSNARCRYSIEALKRLDGSQTKTVCISYRSCPYYLRLLSWAFRLRLKCAELAHLPRTLSREHLLRAQVVFLFFLLVLCTPSSSIFFPPQVRFSRSCWLMYSPASSVAIAGAPYSHVRAGTGSRRWIDEIHSPDSRNSCEPCRSVPGMWQLRFQCSELGRRKEKHCVDAKKKIHVLNRSLVIDMFRCDIPDSVSGSCVTHAGPRRGCADSIL